MGRKPQYHKDVSSPKSTIVAQFPSKSQLDKQILTYKGKSKANMAKIILKNKMEDSTID